MTENKVLTARATAPEEVGVNSAVICEFIKELDKLGMNMHSLMILKDSKVAAECYWHPYKAEIPMSMFSFSKGLTSTAVGIAINEGLLSLSDNVSNYFPFECKTESDQQKYDSMTVYDLITHRSGKKIPVMYDSEFNKWDEFWLNAPFNSAPGKKFSYTSENTYMLSKIITIVTGQTVVEYMTPRFFEPLGIETPFWETDHDGANAGGWGAFLKLEDIAKIGQCYLQKGKWNGQQLIPEGWIKEATFPHITKIPSIFQKHTGYGYQIFVQPEKNTYSFNGLYGQFVVVYPEYNAVFACTSGECDEYTFIHTLNKYLPAAFSKQPLPQSGASKDLQSYIYSKENPIIEYGMRNHKLEEKLKNKTLQISTENPYSGIIGPSTSFMLSKKSGEINNISFDFSGDSLIMQFTENNSDRQTVKIGFGSKFEYTKVCLAGTDYNIAAHGTWTGDDKLVLRIIPLESAQERILTMSFSGDKVKIKSVCTPNFFNLFSFYLMFNGIKPVLPLKPIIKALSVWAENQFNPNYKGVLV